jgi:hypothetical protein
MQSKAPPKRVPVCDNGTVNPTLVADRSGGSTNGKVYMVYTDRLDGVARDADILIRSSDISGTVWSPPTRLNDDDTTNSQFLPQIALDQTTGDVAVAWYDARNSADNTAVELYATVSVDGGITWQPNLAVSSGPSNANDARDINDFGDYNKMDAYGGYFYPIWEDNSG